MNSTHTLVKWDHNTFLILIMFILQINDRLVFRMIRQDWRWQTGEISLWPAAHAPRSCLLNFIHLILRPDKDGDFYTFLVVMKMQCFLLHRWPVVQCWPCGKTGQEMPQLVRRAVAKIASSSHLQKMRVLAQYAKNCWAKDVAFKHQLPQIYF